MNESRYFTFVEIGNNNNKFWNVSINGPVVTTKYGRVGESPQVSEWNLGSDSTAIREYNKKIRSKLKKGYTELEAVISKSTSSIPSNFSLKEIARKEIKTNNDSILDLIEWLAEQNIHNILENTTMTYNVKDGTFTTPLGVIVGQNSITKARSYLSDISKYVSNSDYTNPLLIPIVNQYLRLIPQNLGRNKNSLSPSKIFGSDVKIAKQYEILDALESSLNSSPFEEEAPIERKRLFNCEVNLIEDGLVFDELNKLYKSTNQSFHMSSSFKLDKVYSINIESVRNAFENYGRKLNNIWKLWHGSKASNLLSILKSGLVIPKYDSSFCAGRMFGDGIYMSDQSTKSLNYAAGYWDGKRENRCFMFLCEAAMGKYYIPKYSHDRPKGYDSIFAKKGETSGLMNNEMIVPRTDMVNLLYLCEFCK